MTVFYDMPIKIEVEGVKLLLNEKEFIPDVRRLSEMKEVLLSSKVDPENKELYFMFRGVLSKNGVRYDITVIPQLKIGEEFSKTYGHYHPIMEAKLSFPEIYQVLSGRALFLMQTKNLDGSIGVVAIFANKGDVVLFPPNFGHVSANIGGETLVLANLVADGFASLYGDFKEKRGAAFYYTENGFVKNENYNVARFEIANPKDFNSRYDFSCSDILTEFSDEPEKFEFLKKPSLLIT